LVSGSELSDLFSFILKPCAYFEIFIDGLFIHAHTVWYAVKKTGDVLSSHIYHCFINRGFIRKFFDGRPLIVIVEDSLFFWLSFIISGRMVSSIFAVSTVLRQPPSYFFSKK